MIPTFIVHHPPLTERKNYLEQILPFAKFITNYIPFPKYVDDKDLWASRTGKSLYSESFPHRTLTVGDRDCLNKHYEALGEASLLSTPSLILEDDAIIGPNFFECMYDVTKKKYNHLWDILFIGGAFHHTVAPTIAYEDNNPFVLKGHPCSNTVCSYVVKPNVAASIAHYMYKNNVCLPIDFEMNYICKELNLKVCHYLPYVVTEGSSAGIYKGSQTR